MAGRPATAAAVAILGSLVVAAYANAAAGDLDPSFSKDGKVATPAERDSSPRELLVQPDGALVVAGSVFNFNYLGVGQSSHALVERYLPDGRLDPAFAGDGLESFDFDESGAASASGAALAPDGSIVVVGTAFGIDFFKQVDPHPGVARLTSSGELDPSFAGDGTTTLPIAGSLGSPRVSVAADGSIAIGGSSGGDLAVARLRADGAPETAFSGDGIETTDLGGTDHAVGVWFDGAAVLAAGSGGAPQAPVLARYTAAGALDPAFSDDGLASAALPGFLGATATDRRPDGAVVISGSAGPANGPTDAALARFRPDGKLDPSFGGGGVEVLDLAPFGFDGPRAIATTSDGGLVVALDPGLDGMQTARLDAAGRLDPSFAGDGVVLTDAGGNTDGADAVAVQADGRIVSAGVRASSHGHSNPSDVALARYLLTGPHDVDADGVRDRRDRCKQLYGPRRAKGCPVIERSLRLKARHGRLVGRLTGRRACASAQRVVVLASRHGPDRVVSRLRTEGGSYGAGRFEVGKALGDGDYYAKAPAHLERAVGICGRARSKRVSL